MNGIHCLGNTNVPIPPDVLATDCTGIGIRASADNPDLLNFLNDQLDACYAANKVATVSVQAGRRTPDLVYSNGAQRFSFVTGYVSWLPNASVQKTPVPWDPIYVSWFQGLIAQIGNQYRSHPALVGIKVTGINGLTEEISLPARAGGPVSGPGTPPNWKTTNDLKAWLDIGYHRTKVFNSWATFLNTFRANFGQPLIAQMVAQGLPPIGSGNWVQVNDGVDTLLQSQIMDTCVGQVIQSNDLTTGPLNVPVIARSGQAKIGQQAIWAVTGDTAYRCNLGAAAPPATILQKMLDQCVAAKVSYCELYKEDILNPALQPIWQAAQPNLK